MPTHAFYAASFAALLVAARGAALQHAQVAEREVETNRIRRVDAPERGRHFFRRLPSEGRPCGEAQVPGELVEVRIDGYEKHARRNGLDRKSVV